MNHATSSFAYDRTSADAAFHGIAVRQLMLSILAAIPPESSCDCCLVYRGPRPLAETSVCLATQGAAADDLQLRLIEALERHGIRILQVDEGGPDMTEPIASARDGKWSTL